MKYLTRDFGEIEINESEIINFIQPIYGFEQLKKFTIIHDEEIGESIAWMQSLENSSICFVLINSLSIDYNPKIPVDVKNQIGESKLECWVIAVVKDDFRQTTVNLKSPLFINFQTKSAMQVILEEDYPVKYQIMKGE